MKFKIILLIGLFAILFSFFNIHDFTPYVEDKPPDEVISLDTTIESGSKSVLMVEHILQSEDVQISKTASAVIMYQDDQYYYALTNYHVMHHISFETYEINLYDYLNYKYSAELIINSQAHEIISSSYDLALLKFEKKSNMLPNVIYRETSLNNTVLLTSIGYPNSTRTMAFGYYSSLKSVTGYVIHLLEHTSNIEQGFSGGALLDPSGKLVGINVAGVFDNGQIISAYAIPNTKIKEYLEIFN